MSDEYAKVLPGQPLKIGARAWNAALDAARAVKESEGGLGRGPGGLPPSTGVVYVRNSSGAARSHLDVLGVRAPIILPADNEDEAFRRVTIDGITPDAASSGRFVVLLQPLPDGEIGRGVIDGVTWGRVLVQAGEESAGCADSIIGNASHLGASFSGGTQIVWREAGTGVKNAVLRLGPSCGAGTTTDGSGSGGGGGGNNCMTCATYPARWAVTASGFTGFLAPLNGTHTVYDISSGGCAWSAQINANGTTYLIEVVFAPWLGPSSGQVLFGPAGGIAVRYDFAVAGGDCCTTYTATQSDNPWGADAAGVATVALTGDCSGGGGSGISRASLGAATSNGAAVTTLTRTGVTVEDGALLVVEYANDGVGLTPTGIAWNGHALTLDGERPESGPSPTGRVSVWSLDATGLGGTGSVVATNPSAVACAFAAVEVLGLASNAVVLETDAGGGASTPSVTTPSVVAGCYAQAAFLLEGASPPAWDAPFTGAQVAPVDATGPRALAEGYDVTTGTGALAASMSGTSPSAWKAVVVVYH